MADGSGYGQVEPTDTSHGFNVTHAIINGVLDSKYFVRIVSVLSVNEDNQTVSVQIATNQLDGQGNATPHGTINNIPYAGGQAGTNSFVATPVVGDLGVMVVSDRDISAVQSSKAIANPGSYRKNSAADGIYLLSIFNKSAPTQFMKWTSAGLDFQDASGNTMQTSGSGFVFNTSGDFTVNGISLLHHIHGDVATGTAVSGPPVP